MSGDALDNFISEYIDSFVKWDLVTFFSFNPDVSGTAEDLAARLGRKPEDIAIALEALAQKRLLSETYSGSDKVYRFAPTEELRDKVNMFCEALEDRDRRLQILAKLLRSKAGR